MKELIQKHKNKLVIISPMLTLALLVFGAFYILAISNGVGQAGSNVPAVHNIALDQFNNLDIKAKAFVVYDATDRRVVYSRNEMSQLPLASLTKIMSAIVALDISDRDTIIDIGANDAGLVPGRWRLGDLLKFTLVASSNSGINTISGELSSLKNFLGGEKHFLELMNTKAKSLGLDQTYYLNESGLDINESLAGAYGSPIDMALLFDYALKTDPDIFGATKYDSVLINSIDGYSESALNTNTRVSEISNLVASKTGFTDLAQGNLVIAFDVKKGHRVVVVVMGSTQDGRFADTDMLVKAALAYYSLI